MSWLWGRWRTSKLEMNVHMVRMCFIIAFNRRVTSPLSNQSYLNDVKIIIIQFRAFLFLIHVFTHLQSQHNKNVPHLSTTHIPTYLKDLSISLNFTTPSHFNQSNSYHQIISWHRRLLSRRTRDILANEWACTQHQNFSTSPHYLSKALPVSILSLHSSHSLYSR